MCQFNHIRLMASLLIFILCLTIPIVTQADAKLSTSCNPLSEFNITSLGENAKVCFSVTDIEEQFVDVYLVVQPPAILETADNSKSWLFLDGNDNSFHKESKVYLKNWLISNSQGTVLDQTLPQLMDLVGEHTICALLVSSGKNVFNSDNWVAKSCTALVVNRVNNTQ